jgi:PAS domain S-box-containing protein
MTSQDKRQQEQLKELHDLRQRVKELEDSLFLEGAAVGDLLESEDRVRLIFENMPDAVFIADSETGTIVKVNAAAVRLLGMPRERIVGLNQYRLHPPRLETYVRKEFAKHRVKSGAFPRVDTTVLRVDGSEVPVSIAASGLMLNGRDLVVSVFRDISKSKYIEEELRETERRFYDLLESIDLIAIILNADGQIVFCNQFLLDLTGWNVEEVLQKNWFDLFVPAAAAREQFVRSLKEQSMPSPQEVPVKTRQGSERVIRWHSTILFDLQGEAVGIASIGEDITERRQAEDALRDTKTQLEAVLNGIADGIMVLDSRKQLVYANAMAVTASGFKTPEDMLHARLPGGPLSQYEICDEAGQPVPLERHPSMIALGGRTSRAVVLQYKRKNERETKWVSVMATPLFDRDGTVKFAMVITKDITSARHADLALRRSEEKFRSIYSQSPVGIEIYNAKGKLIDANAACLNIFGIDNIQEIKGSELFADPNITDETKERLRRGVPARFESIFDFDLVRQRKLYKTKRSGRCYIDSLIAPLRGESNEITGYLAHIRDITYRKIADEQIESAHRLLDQTLASLDEAVFVIVPATQVIIAVNETAERIFGYTKDEMVGHNTISLHVSAEEYERFGTAMSRALATAGYYKTEFTMKRRTGEVFPTEHFVRPIRNERGSIENIVSVVRDVTERRHLEEELLRSQKLESVSILAAGIAHDFNNLLQGIIGNIALAKIYTSDEMKRNDRLTDAERIVEMAKELSYRLLTFAKGGEPVRHASHIGDLIRASFSSVIRGEHITCEIDVAADLHPVEIDEGHMTQVFRNLALNAQDAMTGGGMIRVRARNVSITSNDHLPLVDGEYVRISVEDQGVGIPEDMLSKIFVPYFSTKELGSRKGMGLGLAVCHSVVKKHQGAITVESKTGVGSTFHVYLPAYVAPLPSTGVKKSGPVVTPDSEVRILVMDDEEQVRTVVKEILSILHYDVALAHDGLEAIRQYQRSQAEGRPFDLVLLDLTIPGGMGGIDTLQKLREIDSAVRVIVSSGYAADPIIKNFRSYGFDGALAKPYNLEQLREMLHKILNPENR